MLLYPFVFIFVVRFKEVLLYHGYHHFLSLHMVVNATVDPAYIYLDPFDLRYRRDRIGISVR
jgi:hypothetical protein